MIPSTEILLIFPSPRPSREVIYDMHNWLLGQGAEMEHNMLYCLGYREGYEHDAQIVVDEAATLEEIANWPKAGYLPYRILGTNFSVHYNTIADDEVGGVYFGAFEPEYLWNPLALDALFEKMHRHFGAVRTIKGVCIFEDEPSEDVVAAVQKGLFVGEYELDLRQSLDMKDAAHEQIHIPSMGDLDACLEIARSVKPSFRKWYKNNQIAGWDLRVIDNIDKALDEIPFADFEMLTSGKFPFVYVAIQEFKGNAVSLSFMKENGFAMILKNRPEWD